MTLIHTHTNQSIASEVFVARSLRERARGLLGFSKLESGQAMAIDLRFNTLLWIFFLAICATNLILVVPFGMFPSLLACLFTASALLASRCVLHSYGMRFDIDLVIMDYSERVVWRQEVIPPGRLIVPSLAALLFGAWAIELPAGTLKTVPVGLSDTLALQPKEKG